MLLNRYLSLCHIQKRTSRVILLPILLFSFCIIIRFLVVIRMFDVRYPRDHIFHTLINKQLVVSVKKPDKSMIVHENVIKEDVS